jgi:hypothetical protein
LPPVVHFIDHIFAWFQCYLLSFVTI